MAKNTSIILGDQFDEFIKSEIENGRYVSASEMIRSGLRLLKEEREKITAINQALVLGEQSGIAKEFDISSFKTKMKGKLGIDA